MIKIVIFEDHIFMRDSLKNKLSLEKNIEVCFVTSNKVNLYEFIDKTPSIHLIIADYLAEDVVGPEVFEWVCKFYPKIKVIAFTSLKSPILVENLLALGVKGYVHKTQPIEDLIKAINEVYNNELYLPNDFSFLKDKKTPEPKNLTSKELEIVRLIALEFSSSDISERLGISIRTVDTHKKNIFAKLDVKNSAGMVREAIKLGLLE